MATIDEVRDIVFYILRKLNDVIVNLTTEPPRRFTREPPRRFIREEQPPPLRITHEEMVREIERVRRMLNPTPTPPPPPSPSPQEMIGKFIKQDEERIIDLQKQANEKRIILNYLSNELIQRRERKEDAIVIKLLEEEFERLRLERERLEKRIIELKEHIKFMQN